MLTFTSATPIYLVAGVTDMRKSFDGLSAIVTNHLRADPLSGAVYVFCNRKRDRIKLLVWDRSGFWVFAKRLERGTFAWPAMGHKAVDLTREELTLLVGGIDLQHTRRRRWYRCAQTSRVSS
ncbi:MAG: IS66 family insertion sequence element accessory protein TnpB [Gemmatimonadota bacterium]|nr:MAG: IS66 family insertion sequence element accessory protein TnpB [Gemmatimonadota bacterium]